jgi:hypothetical protein
MAWSWMKPRHKLKGNTEENFLMQDSISIRLNPTYNPPKWVKELCVNLKRGVVRQMLRSGCPKRLWDDCIIREEYVRSHTSLDIYGLEGQVTERKIKGETVNISTIAEYAWYEWVKLRDTAAEFSCVKDPTGKGFGCHD